MNLTQNFSKADFDKETVTVSQIIITTLQIIVRQRYITFRYFVRLVNYNGPIRFVYALLTIVN